MANADKGMVFDAGSLTVAAYLKTWLETIEGTLADNTYQGYARMVHNHLIPTLGKNLLKNLTPAHVRNLYRSKSDSGLSTRTVQYIHVALHRTLKQAVYDGLIPRNVAEGVKPPKLEQKEAEYLTQEQARRLLDAAEGNRVEALYTVALHTGMREGELLGLKWEDWVTKDKLSVRGTKSKSSRRPVKLSQTAQYALRSHRKRQNE
jgi:integrase